MNEKIDVLITIGIEESLVNALREVSPRLNIHINRAARVEDINPDVWAAAEILYTGRMIPAPEQAPDLRWIQFHFAGIDHAREAPIMRRDGLIATTMSGASASQVAEYVVMMMLALGHRLPDMMDHQRKAIWPKDRWERFIPQELRGATVGLVGYGSIARQVARLVRTFGMKAFATKRDAMHPADTGYSVDGFGDLNGDLVDRLYPAEALKSMVKIVDFLVVTVPLSPDTYNLIDSEILNEMKDTAYIVDAARGGVINQADLINALKESRIAGAALDVFPEEPLSADSILWKLPNVILTPHISGISSHYDERAMLMFAENLRRYINGQELLNRFDVRRGY
jgi:phosphoglycerate dehydrogenase-like enzyme